VKSELSFQKKLTVEARKIEKAFRESILDQENDTDTATVKVSVCGIAEDASRLDQGQGATDQHSFSGTGHFCVFHERSGRFAIVIQRAEKIVVVDTHPIVASGKHNELMEICSNYHDLIKRQSFAGNRPPDIADDLDEDLYSSPVLNELQEECLLKKARRKYTFY